MRRLHYRRLWLAGWIASMAATLVVCLLPMPDVAPGIDHFDKFAHAAGFALLAAYAAMLFDPGRRLRRAAFGLLGLGVLIELLQLLVPWRSAEPLDLLADATGVLAGLAVAATPLARLLPWVDARLSRRVIPRS